MPNFVERRTCEVRRKLSPSPAVLARGALAVLLGHSLELRARLAQVLQDHHGMDLDLRPQREHEGFDQGGICDASCMSTTMCAPLAPSTSTK